MEERRPKAIVGRQRLPSQKPVEFYGIAERAIGERSVQPLGPLRSRRLAGDDQFAVFDLRLDPVVLMAVLVLDGVNRLRQLEAVPQLRPSDSLPQQLRLLSAGERVSADHPPDPLCRQGVGVVLHLDENESTAPAVTPVGLEDRMSGGPGPRKGIQDHTVLLGGNLNDAPDQLHRLWCVNTQFGLVVLLKHIH